MNQNIKNYKCAINKYYANKSESDSDNNSDESDDDNDYESRFKNLSRKCPTALAIEGCANFVRRLLFEAWRNVWL